MVEFFHVTYLFRYLLVFHIIYRSNKVASECSDNLRNLVTRLESFISDKSINTKVQPVKSIKNKEPENKINESDSENENFEPYQAKSRSLERKKSNVSTPLKENNRNVVETIDEVTKNVSYSTKDEQQGSSEKKKELDTSQESKMTILIPFSSRRKRPYWAVCYSGPQSFTFSYVLALQVLTLH